MPETGIPSEVQRFIVSQIKSLEQLEVLLVLFRASTRTWSAESVHAVVQSNVASVAARLEEWCEAGFLEKADGASSEYRYAPTTPDRAALVTALAAAYQERRIRVVELIYAERPARTFADAFRFKKDR